MTQPKKRAYCYACNTDFEYDWKEWAKHQNEMCAKDKRDKAHKKNIRFAARILTNVRYLNAKRDLPGRTPLDKQDKENKDACKRKVSGKTLKANCMCPQCKRTFQDTFLEEYITEDVRHTWKHDGYLMRLCVNHRDAKYDFAD